jgi:hypothetical protein
MYIPKILNGLQKALGDNPRLMQLTNQNHIYHIFGGSKIEKRSYWPCNLQEIAKKKFKPRRWHIENPCPCV